MEWKNLKFFKYGISVCTSFLDAELFMHVPNLMLMT